MPHGDTDRGVLLPQVASATGQQDSAALQAVRAYQSAVGLVAWNDMQGFGSMVSTTGNSDAARNVVLYLGKHGKTRLDTQMPQGERSVRMLGAYGVIQRENGSTEAIDSRNALDGLVAYPLLDDPNFPDASLTLIDQGNVTVDGVSLHRVSVASPWPGTGGSPNGNPPMSVVDFYFNPTTHLLIKSASSILNNPRASEPNLQVISYADYQPVDGMLIPFQCSETLNGQQMWTLQLNQVKLNNGFSDSDFHF